jgi:hypothetical protein
VPFSLGGIALPFLAILAACDLTVANTVSLDSPCSSKDDCPSGQVCFASGEAGSTAGTCQNTCNTKSDCAPGLACMEYGGQGVCVAPIPDAAPGVDVVDATEEVVGADVATDAANDGPGVTDGASGAGNDAGDATVGAGDAATGAADATVDADAASDATEDASDAANEAADATEDASDGANEAGDAASDAPFVCDAEPAPSTIVLFGGLSDKGNLQDTWTWNGQSWSQQDEVGDAGEPNPSTSPDPRHNAAMSSICGYAEVLGGVGNSGFSTDAWQWNGAVWQVAPSAPPSRAYASAAALNGVLYLFGGIDSSTNASVSLFAWSGGEWGPAPQATPAALYPRLGATLTNSPDGLVLFGGFDIFDDAFSDTWLLTDTGWQPLNGEGGATVPGDDSGPGFGFAAAASWRTSVVLFGGEDGNGDASPDTWIWDGSTWTVAPRQQDGPAARFQAAMASLNGQVVLFGGLDSQGHILGDTWIWNGSWTPGPDAGPPARYDATMTSY